MKFEPRYCEKNVNAPSHHHFGDFIRLSLWLLGMVCVAYFLLGFAADKIVERLPPKLETVIAAGITPSLDRDHYPRTRQYLQKILDSLVASEKGLPELQYKVSIQDEATVNAVALPGGHIVVFRGLLSQLRSENELAVILAHELGHYAHRDQLHGLGRGLVLLSIMAALGFSGDLPGFIAPSVQTLNLKYSRDRESAADLFAIDLLARKYGHAGGGIDAFKVLAHQKQGMKGPEFTSTHPDIRWRMETMAKYLQAKKYAQRAVTALPEPGVLPFPEESR